ncbi:MAG: PAS domain-containing sensor histidine kinase [Alphaproteobacteria bacterium]|nr:PAS domain-containing sensor histidine kinase [Alphaproteobacteria bacterium]
MANVAGAPVRTADAAPIEPNARPTAVFDPSGTLIYQDANFARLFSTAGGQQTLTMLAADLRRAGTVSGEAASRSLPLHLTGARLRAEIFALPRESGFTGFAVYVTDQMDEATQLRQLHVERTYLYDLLSSCSDWVWTVDVAGRLTHLTGALTRLLGRPTSRLTGGRFADFASFSTEGVVDLTDLPAFKRRTGFRDCEIVLQTAQGGELRQRIAGVPQFDGLSGAFLGFCGTGIDMSHEAEIEAALSESRVKLETAMLELRQKNVALQHALAASEAANLAKAGFLAGMSHELRTPLNTVIGYAEALTSGVIQPSSEQHKRITGDIASSGRLLLRLINDVLEMASLDNDKVKVTPVPTELKSIIAEARAAALSSVAEKRLDISAVEAPGGIRVMVDRVRATQIFINLFNNAAKYTPPGAMIGVNVGEPQDGMIEITVWDSGPGIPADKRDQIFAAFTRLTVDSYQSSAGGVGLGLTISRRLAALMGGWLDLHERHGGGCEFVVRLPLAPGETDKRSA